ncbi:MAG: DNA/RNA helicase domain-containing protein [Chitinophagaceae bacterium]
MKNVKAFMYKGKNQVEDIINTAKVSIFYIDEKQIIRPEDIGTLEEISRVAELYNAKMNQLNLRPIPLLGCGGLYQLGGGCANIEETKNYILWLG